MEERLKHLKHDFSPEFTDSVMKEILNNESNVFVELERWRKPILWLSAACIVILLASTFILNGELSTDAVIGLEGYSELELSDLISN